MKKVIAVLLTCVILVGAISAYSVLVSAEGDASCSLTLCYGRGGAPLGGISVKVYRIAEAVDDGRYRLCGKFADYPVNVYGITSQSEWKKITSTLASYIAADKIPLTTRALPMQRETYASMRCHRGFTLPAR